MIYLVFLLVTASPRALKSRTLIYPDLPGIRAAKLYEEHVQQRHIV
jgi:hypothetical protein